MKIATSSVLVTYLCEYVVAHFIHSHCSSCKVRIQSPFYDASTSSKEGLNEKTIQRCVLIMGRYVEQVQRRRGTAAPAKRHGKSRPVLHGLGHPAPPDYTLALVTPEYCFAIRFSVKSAVVVELRNLLFCIFLEVSHSHGRVVLR